MGISIRLNINPARINNHDWESMYQESLKLLEAYDFMDKIVDKETFKGFAWIYGDKAKERRLALPKDAIGWYVFGDVVTMETGENFTLRKDLNTYKQETQENENCCEDIYLYLFKIEAGDNGQLKNEIPYYPEVFDSKTQGFDYHNYVLAIALLIESRFPHNAVVYGDISKGQIIAAIEWANSILVRPINMPDRTDDHTLLQRLRVAVKDEDLLLQVFVGLTFSEKNIEFGNFLLNHFEEKAIKKYYYDRFKRMTVNTLGFSDVLFEFLSMGLGLEMLCEICVLDEEGCKIPPIDFIKNFMRFSFHIMEDEEIKEIKRALQYSCNNPDSETPDTVESLFGKTVLKMVGLNSNLKPFIPLERIKRTFSEKFSSIIDIEEVFSRDSVISQKANSENERLLRGVYQFAEEQAENQEFDIHTFESLIHWQPGDTFSDEVAQELKKVKEASDKTLNNRGSKHTARSTVNAASKKIDTRNAKTKMETLISSNKYVIMKKETWDYLQENIHNENIFERFVSVLRIRADEKTFHYTCRALLNNLSLFEHVFLKEQS